MGTVLKFIANRNKPVNRERTGNKGGLVIFPGVRYERGIKRGQKSLTPPRWLGDRN